MMSGMKKTPEEAPHPERRRARGRRAEDHLLPNFRELTDNAVQGILVHCNFKPVYANAAYARLFGYDSAAEILALPLIRPLVPPDKWAQVEEDYDDLMRGEKKATIARTRGLRHDGQEIWLSVTERVIDWHGVPALQINAFDISHQVAIEQMMLDNEQLLRAMIEILPVPIYIERARDGRLLFVNRKTCLLLQQSTGPLLHARATDFFIEPEDHAKLNDLLHTIRDIREVEVNMRSAQGRAFTAELAAIQMDYDGEPAVLVSLNDISQRKQLEAELFAQANTDALTGISNRRHFMIQAEQELRRAQRFERPLSVMMIDLDFFKQVNDTYGHAAGDTVLEKVVQTALESLRQSDTMGRLGGEEFAVLLPETDRRAAADAAERLRAHLAETPIDIGLKKLICTASVGVATLDRLDDSIDDLLRRADEALLRAKRNGRNRVESAGDDA
jgi:diguanylate cyclase (GGDEF)-like protein/PAS domain S-box-containing protein